MKKIALLLCCIFTLSAAAQKKDDRKFLTGAVTMGNGMVVFKQNYKVEGKSSVEILNLLQKYVETKLVKGENSLEQSRITDLDKGKGLLAASIAETLYFRRSALVTHSTRFFYQLIYRTDKDGFSVEMRRLRYSYDEMKTNGDPALLNAEEWITDNEALNKNKTKLTRIAGKFRKFTILRKDNIFAESAAAVGGVPTDDAWLDKHIGKCEGKDHKCDKAAGNYEGMGHKCDKAAGKCKGKEHKCDKAAGKCEGKEHKCDKAAGKCEGKEHKCDKTAGKCEGMGHKCDKAAGKCKGKEHKCDKAAGKCEGKEHKCDKAAGKCEGKEHKCDKAAGKCEGKEHKCDKAAGKCEGKTENCKEHNK